MNKINGHLIIVEGPDHAGKTKLCNYLIETYKFNYWHHGVYKDVRQAHSECLDTVLENIKNYNSNWIIDRLHVSEEVYGNIFRNIQPTKTKSGRNRNSEKSNNKRLIQ